MYVRHEVSKARCEASATVVHHRDDAFAQLVRRVAADPHNPYNIEGYLWVLEEPAPRTCDWCGERFDPWESYNGNYARGVPRRFCSLPCRNRLHQVHRRPTRRAKQWGSAA